MKLIDVPFLILAVCSILLLTTVVQEDMNMTWKSALIALSCFGAGAAIVLLTVFFLV